MTMEDKKLALKKVSVVDAEAPEMMNEYTEERNS